MPFWSGTVGSIIVAVSVTMRQPQMTHEALNCLVAIVPVQVYNFHIGHHVLQITPASLQKCRAERETQA